MTTTEPSPPFRILPKVSDRNRHFWEGGRNGELVFLQCDDCGYLIHPPQPICPVDWGKHLSPKAVSGRGTVATYSINHQNWMPGPELPYVVALVEIEEQPDVRLMTNIVGCAPDDVYIGMPVEVVFEEQEDADGKAWLPLFQPQASS